MSHELAYKIMMTEVECVFSTINPSGQSNSAVLYYYFDSLTNRFYMPSRSNTAKAVNVMSNSSSSLVIRPNRSPYEIQSVGNAKVIDLREDVIEYRKRIFESLARKYPELGFTPAVLAPNQGAEFIIIEYQPGELKFTDLTKLGSSQLLEFSNAVTRII